MAVRANATRTGVFDYLGREVDPTGTRFNANDRVAVYRPESEVFARESVHSFLMKPITNDHPTVPVTSKNWKDHAKGAVAKAMRDGDHLNFDLILMDADAIADVDAGKRELSNGYACDLSLEDGIAPDGKPYQAVQRNIRGNHVAIVDRGRAGPECRIRDFAVSDALPATIFTDGEPPMTTKTITFDGLPLLVTDAAEAVIGKLQATITTLTTDKATADTKVAELTTAVSTKDAEIVTLTQAVKDAAVTPQQMRDAAAAYARTVDQAKKLASAATITDAMDEGAIKKVVVLARLGDAAKDWNDAQIAASFGTLSAALGDGTADPLRTAIINQPVNIGDAATDSAKARAERMDRYATGHRAAKAA